MPDSVPLTLPAMGESVTEGTVSRWLKAVGDSVSEGESMVEVTTDKVDVEVPAPAAGVLESIVAQEGDTVTVGATLATIAAGANGSAAPTGESATPEATVGAARSVLEGGGATAALPEPASAPERPAGDTPPAEPQHAGAPAPPASPLARRRAALAGLSLASVQGGGPDGLVRTADVSAAAERTTPAAAPRIPVAAPESGAVELRGPAAALVDHMERSRDIPTATSFRTIAVTVLDARRRELNLGLTTAGKQLKVSYTHLIGHAVARAAAEMPEMSAHFARTESGRPGRVDSGVHLGLAVDSHRKDGTRFLVVPVIRDAGGRSFADFRAEYERLIERARTNTLDADELRGATITLTNPGGIGTVASVPRLMTGQGTIVAVGALGYAAEWRGVAESRLRELGVAKVMTMTSTYDHRIIQGAQSGEFLGRIEALLNGDGDFYASVFESLGVGLPAADLPRTTRTDAAATTSAAEEQPASGAMPSRQMLGAVQAATSLIKAHRTHGHLGAHLDPLGTPPLGDPAMEPETYGLTPDIMEMIPADVLRVYVPGRNLAEVLPNLRRTYCGTIAYEIEHIASHEQRVWLREHIESGAYRMPFSGDQKRRLLQRLTKVEAMERYLRRTFIGQKTFSAEGVDAMVPMLEALLTAVADDGIGEVVMGMSHRGRLATIAHVVNRPYAAVLVAFERGEMRRAVTTVDAPTGDVKYHIGSVGTYTTDAGKGITVRLLSNPSHLEAVDPVVEGWTRAEQTKRSSSTLNVDPMVAVPVLMHGDAAFAGQGIVAEVFNLQSLAGYATGGTVHIITNNQVGFTTEAGDARSTRYASDLAKGFDVPIVHVNADDIEACINAVRLAWDYRRTYHRDVVIDLIGYRRFGHNETDEPSYTQPLMYQKIKEHPTAREIYMRKLVAEGLITEADGANDFETAYSAVAEAHKRVKASLASDPGEDSEESTAAETEAPRPVTRVPAETLLALNEQLATAPADFHVYPKLAKQLERRHASLTDGGPIDWGTAESLAFASLLVDGHPIRLSGQDTQRGTFSQRHLVFHDDRTGAQWIPMEHLLTASATFEVYNSPLSEVGCLGFEYGYSAADPSTMVLWEAQYGDFVNNAEMVVDQFISSARAKWGQRSRLVLLLPHGYEGNGPEHSSARLERFLQLSAHGNMRVAACSTAAQYFHLLRDQAMAPIARPLVIMTPKSLLRLKESACSLDDLVGGEFRSVIDDPLVSDATQRKKVRTLLLCTGKIYYELALHPDRAEAEDLAIVRVELLNPLPVDEVLGVVRTYPGLEQIYWVQEEPANMGAWPHLSRPIGKNRPYDIRWDYIGRPRRASPSEGSAGSHHIEQERIVNTALASSHALAGRQHDADQLQHADLKASADPKTAGDA